MKASIVIRAKNEARDIGDTLSTVFGQAGVETFEVIVVDSGSTDGTLAIVRGFPTTLIEIPPHEFTYGRSLNIGIREASGEFAVALSAHSIPTGRNWLAELLAPFSDPSIGAVYGQHIPRENVTLLELLGMRMSGVTSPEPRRQEHDMMFSNANGAVRRQLAIEHPFAENIRAGEDFEWADWAQHRGWAVYYQPTAAVYHSHGESLARLARRIWNDQPDIFRLKLAALLPRSPVLGQPPNASGTPSPQPSPQGRGGSASRLSPWERPTEAREPAGEAG